MSGLFASCLFGNNTSNSELGKTDSQEKIRLIYEKALANGFDGSYEEWLESIKGTDGQDGVGIVSISLTQQIGNVDVYLISLSNGTSSTFTITNGKDGKDGADGRSVVSIEKTGTNGLLDTYTITYSDQTSSYFVVANGAAGKDGADGQDGKDGKDGVDGKDGITYVPAIFYNYDGTKLYEFYYECGSTISYNGPTPTKVTTEDSQEVAYVFDGWDKSLENITKPTIYTATFKGPEYTCTFKNYDGSTLYTTTVERGYSVTYQASNPTRPNDGEVMWNFTGWDKSLDNIKADTVFTAQYYSPNGIKCTFKNYDGTLLDTIYCGSGDRVTYDGTTPTKEDEEEDGIITKYTFTGWDKSLKNIQADTIFTAQFSSTDYYACTFVNYDGTELYKTSTFSGGQVTYIGSTPTKPQGVSGTTVTDYSFSSWSSSLSNITVPTTFTAQFSSNTFTGYKVTFKDNNGEVLYSHYFKEGTTARYPYETPYSYDANNVYMFAGWSQSLENISQELTVKAKMVTVSRKQVGEYPQSLVTDTQLIEQLNKITQTDAQGYKVYNNEKYLYYYGSSYTDNNGNSVSRGYHYYKVEPIKWKYLGEKDGDALFVSEYILDCKVYNSSSDYKTRTDYQGNVAIVYGNNYKYSDIRTWLNTTFLDNAFYYDDSLIVTTTVDNSVASTGYTANEYVCETTNDKVFLLSYQELTSSSYGFIDSDSREAQVTEYVRAKDSYYSTSNDSLYNGYYWTRSPYCNFSDYAYSVDYDGDVYSLYVYNYYYGVRPALVFSFDEN